VWRINLGRPHKRQKQLLATCFLILIPSHPTYPNIVDEEKKPPPHPSANRKTAQNKKQPIPNARTWDEKTLGDLIPTKQEIDARRKPLLLPHPVATTKNFDLLLNKGV
jgi:hypothetical protein